MNNKKSRALWISVGAGFFSIFLFYSYSQEKKAEYDRRYGSMKTVVVAARDIHHFETIDDTALDTIERPVDFIEPGAVNDLESIIGQVAAAPMQKGEQILSNKLLTPGPDTGLALQVAPGNRAITIPVSAVSGVAKLIRPGDRVDILASLSVGQGQKRRTESRVLMQNVTVLATGVRVVNNVPRTFELAGRESLNQINLNSDTKFTNITLETSLADAQNLVLLLSGSPGSLYLVLRNPNDRNVQRLRSTNMMQLLRGGLSYGSPRARGAMTPRSPAVSRRPKLQVKPAVKSKKRTKPLFRGI